MYNMRDLFRISDEAKTFEWIISNCPLILSTLKLNSSLVVELQVNYEKWQIGIFLYTTAKM